MRVFNLNSQRSGAAIPVASPSHMNLVSSRERQVYYLSGTVLSCYLIPLAGTVSFPIVWQVSSSLGCREVDTLSFELETIILSPLQRPN